MSVWFITGASRGFGIEIAREALRRGHHVVATARTPDPLSDILGPSDHLLVLPLDITDEAQAQAAVEEAIERFGRIDVLVNNAGVGLLGAVEEASDAETRTVFDVNVHGTLSVTRAVLPYLRAQRSGTIITITSSGGFVSRAGWGVYCATKFALEGISEALKAELAPLGIGVIAIEPGGFRTDALDTSSLAAATLVIDDYADTAGQTRKIAAAANHSQPGDPARAAAVIVDLEHANPLPARIQLGQDCFDLVATKLETARQEQARWHRVSVSTGFTTNESRHS